MTTVVVIENPTWFQKETSIPYFNSDGSIAYMVIYRFGFNVNTKCSFQETGIKIRPCDALEGALYGWYECRLLQPKPERARILKYEKDTSTLQAAIGVSAILAIGACFVGK
jgi:hypothetical protein